jgi:sugar transferase (PEP-CTERM/EpsH1 system associated)
MRILWVKVGGLWPPDTGGRIRSFQMISELSRSHRVVLLTTHRSKDERRDLLAALPHCERIDSIPHEAPKAGTAAFAAALARSWLSPLPVDMLRWRSRTLRRRIREEITTGDLDLCVSDFLVSFASFPRKSRVPLVLFEHNVEHLLWKRLASLEPAPLKRALLELEWRKIRRFESRACRLARRTVTVSEQDRAFLAKEARGADFRVVATGVDTTFYRPNGAREDARKLVFTGSMDWYPNEDAVLDFLDASFPRIRRETEGVSLTVVGRNPSPKLRAAASRDVTITGTVPDVRPYVAEAAVYIVPLRLGSGTRLKIFEALAMGKAVVSTTLGAEGLPLVPGEHYLRADEPADFAREVTALLKDPERRRRLGAAGRRLVEERFSWPQVTREFQNDIADLGNPS